MTMVVPQSQKAARVSRFQLSNVALDAKISVDRSQFQIVERKSTRGLDAGLHGKPLKFQRQAGLYRGAASQWSAVGWSEAGLHRHGRAKLNLLKHASPQGREQKHHWKCITATLRCRFTHVGVIVARQ
jgi:hypothetical protein